MHDPMPLLRLSKEQRYLLSGQLLVYQHYLQKSMAPSKEPGQTVQMLIDLRLRLNALCDRGRLSRTFHLTIEEAILLKEAVSVLQQTLESLAFSPGRDLEIRRCVAMNRLFEQSFPSIQVS